MLFGMARSSLGVRLAGYGLLPSFPERTPGGPLHDVIAPPEKRAADGRALAYRRPAGAGAGHRHHEAGEPRLRHAGHARSNTASARATVALLPFAALTGTVVGSFVWGTLADLYGRRASILLSVGDVHRHLDLRRDAEFLVERRHVLPDGRGRGRHAAGGLRAARGDHADPASRLEPGAGRAASAPSAAIFAASALSALLQPLFGWRIMWFLNLPTGLILVLLSPLSARVRPLPAAHRPRRHRARRAGALRRRC